MKRFFLLSVSLACIFGTFAPPAAAQLVDEEEVGKFTIGGVLGIVGSDMGDINDNFSTVGKFLDTEGVTRLDKIKASALTGLNARYKFKPWLTLSFTWGALQNRATEDWDAYRARFFSRATTYTASVFYNLPQAEVWNERLQLYGGGGIMLLRGGLVQWSFEDRTDDFWHSEWTPTSPDLAGDLAELSGEGQATATGNGFHLSLGSSYQLTYRVSAAVDFGYRSASLTEFTYDDADFSGQFEDFVATEVETREPGDWAIYDFFFRDPDAVTPDGRSRRDVRTDPELEKTGCRDCPLFYEGGQIEIDYSGFYAQLAIRLHLF